MFSTFLSIIFAVGFASFGSGLDAKHRAILKEITECLQVGFDTEAAAQLAKGGEPSKAEKIEDVCIFLRVRIDLKSSV